MRRAILSILLLSSLSGCVYQEVDHVEVEKAIKYCEDKGGLRSLKESFLGVTDFRCRNGDRISEGTYDDQSRNHE